MQYNVILPDEQLRGIIKHYVVIPDMAILDKVLFLPNAGNFLIFNRGADVYVKVHPDRIFDIPKGYSIGIKTTKAKKTFLSLSTLDGTVPLPIILVELLPSGYHKLFNRDASALRSGYKEMDEDIKKKYFAKLYQNESIEADIDYLNDSLFKLYDSHKHKPLCLDGVLEKIVELNFEVTVSSLADEFGCTRRTLERQFKKVVGISPSSYIFISKLCKTILEYIDEGKSLKDMEYIYSDNAHLNKIFQNVIGCVPSKLFYDVVIDKNMQIYQSKRV
ncbi:helix-turn-helix domain-containing protein [Sulfurimonas sp. SAG-AH-194-L11]|nr:helix-turn-helix domain-containing protein [Sulfurimonas sp. SAG-AH-194-L11]MDF1877023.1 helix-turn-helix domain-containing protein [Sulfurimonas sp. SAG-AH-194-L11]